MRDPDAPELLSVLLVVLVAACLLALVTVAVASQNIAASLCFLGFSVLFAPIVRAMVDR